MTGYGFKVRMRTKRSARRERRSDTEHSMPVRLCFMHGRQMFNSEASRKADLRPHQEQEEFLACLTRSWEVV